MESSTRPYTALTLAAAVVCLLLAPSLASAQAIGGTVTDSTGSVLPGVTVEARSPALIEQVRTTVTDGSGQYQIVALETGVYDVTFTLPGFSTLVREGVELSTGFSANINIELAVGTLAETVTVTEASPIIDVQNVVQSEFVQKIETLAIALAHTIGDEAVCIAHQGRVRRVGIRHLDKFAEGDVLDVVERR